MNAPNIADLVEVRTGVDGAVIVIDGFAVQVRSVQTSLDDLLPSVTVRIPARGVLWAYGAAATASGASTSSQPPSQAVRPT